VLFPTCLSVCLCVSTNQKIVLATCLVVWTTNTSRNAASPTVTTLSCWDFADSAEQTNIRKNTCENTRNQRVFWQVFLRMFVCSAESAKSRVMPSQTVSCQHDHMWELMLDLLRQSLHIIVTWSKSTYINRIEEITHSLTHSLLRLTSWGS